MSHVILISILLMINELNIFSYIYWLFRNNILNEVSVKIFACFSELCLHLIFPNV